MSTYFTTQQKRSYTKLRLALDQWLLPFMADGVVLAISGGADSRALLEAVSLWQGRHQGKIVVATIDHSVRPQSAKESEWVASRAQSLGFKAIHEVLLGVVLQGEQDFRKARYECLRQVALAEGCSNIVLAHNSDDDAEGFLMSLLGKGGGAHGAAMQPCEEVDGIRLIRPFLGLFKKDLLQFLTLHGYTNFVRDNHDLERKNERAKVRLELMPILIKKDHNFVSRAAKYAQRQRDTNRYLKDEAKHMVAFLDAKGATLDLSLIKNALMLETTIKSTLKKLAPHRDMRASEPVVSRILDACSAQFLKPSGLDQSSKLFKVNLLEEKQYQFPGVLVRTSGNKLVFTLI